MLFLGPVFGRTDFSRFLLLGRRIFSRIVSPDFFSSFLWGTSAQKNPPGTSPAKSSKIYATKIPNTFLQRIRPNSSSCIFATALV